MFNNIFKGTKGTNQYNKVRVIVNDLSTINPNSPQDHVEGNESRG